MNETVLTVVGNVATEPVLRSTTSGVKVASFRLASTERRYDKGLKSWRDGETLFWWVTCWRALGENVVDSVEKGQPVVVQGKLHERSYDDKDGQRRTTLEIEASTVGHDLSRGVAVFRKAAGVHRDVVPIEDLDGVDRLDDESGVEGGEATGDIGGTEGGERADGLSTSFGGRVTADSGAGLGDTTAA